MSGALRFVLVLMLSLAIPAYGFAGLSAQQAPCPMAHVDTEPESAAPLHHGDIDAEVDCCAGQDDSAGTDQACEMSQDCAGVHAVHIIDGRVPHAMLLEILTDQAYGTMIRSH